MDRMARYTAAEWSYHVDEFNVLAFGPMIVRARIVSERTIVIAGASVSHGVDLPLAVLPPGEHEFRARVDGYAFIEFRPQETPGVTPELPHWGLNLSISESAAAAIA